MVSIGILIWVTGDSIGKPVIEFMDLTDGLVVRMNEISFQVTVCWIS